MKEISPEEARQLIVGLLNVFDALCKKHNLRYTLSDGTLLGAVRHQGFIPWDDDIDVSMPRDDYEQLRAHFHEWNQESYLELLDFRTNPDYAYSFLKLQDARTEIENTRKNSVSIGMNIDIFPLDAIPGGKMGAPAVIWLCHFLKMCHSLANRAEWRVKKFTVPVKILRFVFRILTLGAKPSFFSKVQEFLATRCRGKKTPYTSNLMWRSSMKRGAWADCIPSSSFDTYTELEFCGRTYPCIAGYDSYLTHFYGDYMTPPPVKERTNVHLLKMWWK